MSQKYARHAAGAFGLKSWDEKTYSEVDGGPKLTRASVTNTFQGDIEGEGRLEYLMVYRSEASASFLGLEQVAGRIGDRSGSFVLQHQGVFEDGQARGAWSVVPGSGSGDLAGLRGEGSYVATHEQPTPFSLDYDFEA